MDASGLVTGVAEGSATIFASAGSVQGRAHIAVVNPVASPDREILVALYNATDGPNCGYAFNWLTDAPLGSWYGVEVDARGRVTELDLSVNNLSGSIPPELGKLASLEILGLSDSNLSGPIPPELGNLTRLERLQLAANELTGLIPQSFLALDMLTRFSFGDNAGLCAPNTTEFVTWLQSIDNVYGPFCTASSSSPNRLGSRPDGPRTYGGG